MPLALRLSDVDPQVARWFRAEQTPRFVEVLSWLSSPGSELWVATMVIGLALIFAFRRWFRAAATLLITVPIGSLAGEGLKLLVQRPRPFVAGPFGEWGGYSFPSGHTLAATMLYGCLLLLAVPLLKRRRWRSVAIGTAALMVLGVAFSRVALGAHYLTDVVAAMCFGSCWVLASSLLIDRLRRRLTREAVPSGDQPARQV